jgi:hypothetical protein
MKYVPKAAKLVHRSIKPVRRLGRIQIMAQGKSKIDFEPARAPVEVPLQEGPVVEADEEEIAEEIPDELVPADDATVESDEEESDDSTEDDDAVPVITLYKATKAQMRPGSYFSINFSKAQDGSIAIANSFSTGNKGRSESRSTSYGSPRN